MGSCSGSELQKVTVTIELNPTNDSRDETFAEPRPVHRSQTSTERIILARYGAVPQVARFTVSMELLNHLNEPDVRGRHVVVQTERGPELARTLQLISGSGNGGGEVGLSADEVTSDPSSPTSTGNVLRWATEQDVATFDANVRTANVEFSDWHSRIVNWKMDLQLIDLEWTLDRGRLILYVLNDRNAETTRLALLAAAGGLGIVHVQPVSADGIVPEKSGGCGSGGCGSGGCSHG